MTTATFSQVRTALASQLLNTVTGLLNAHADVPDSYAGPCVVVQPAPGGDFINYRPVLGDDCDYNLYVTLYVPAADAVAGQQAMDAFLAPSGPASVVAAINSGGTLGGVVASIRCNGARGYRAEQIDEQRYAAVDFPVEVMT